MTSPRIHLTPTTLQDIAASPLGRAALRDRISLTPTKMTEHWYWYTLPDGTHIGFGAWAERPRNVARLKGLYVSPEHRGRGYGTRAQAELLQTAFNRGYDTAEQIAVNPLWWKRQGWTAHRPSLKNGAQHLRMPTGRAITELLNT